jgi:tetratricopeptide (TPR) repeat protein
MRLEIDTTVSAHPLADETTASGSVVDSTEVKSTLNQGIKAAQAGNRAQARTSLLRATELDPRNENAWLWLASISEYPEELLGFLNHVLEINPENQRAKEWKVATHALLSRTFVQRGIDAAQENQKEFAAECFQTALEYDDRNAVAWMWMASLSDSPSVKVSLLEKALEVEPGNEAATTALDAAKSDILKARLSEAKSAAVAGNNIEAINILDSLLAVKPDSVEAWTMKSHLSEGFDEKIRCFESILALDPDNVAAKSGRDSLLTIFGTVEAANSEQLETSFEADASAPIDTENSSEMLADKSPTEDLELPGDLSQAPTYTLEAKFENTPEVHYENEEPEIVAEPFATYAEEAALPDATTTSNAGDSPVEAELNDLHFGPAVEELPEAEEVYADPQTETAAITYDLTPESVKTDDNEAGYNS